MQLTSSRYYILVILYNVYVHVVAFYMKQKASTIDDIMDIVYFKCYLRRLVEVVIILYAECFA